MLYHVTIQGRTIEVDISDGRVTVAGREAANAELRSLRSPGEHHLLVDGVSHAVLAHNSGNGLWSLHIGGRRMDAEVVDERTRAIRALAPAAAGPAGPRPLRAPMPGMITRIEVAAGDAVAGGQGVLIMEAMKMENELRAAGAGVVTRILVEAGQAVEKGAILVEFSAAPQTGATADE
jgi:pyruvate carboxylase subunit B